ncbi:MAG: DUF4397 domain-containing protein [Pedococcus sp.]
MRRRFVHITTFALIGSATLVLATTPAQGAAAPRAPAPGSGPATVYLIQGVDATTMAFTVDGSAVAASAAAKEVVGPLKLAPGQHTLVAKPAGGGASVTATVRVAAGASVDAVLHRQADVSKPPVFTAYTNDLSAVTAGSSRLTVAHTAAVGPADIRVKGKVLFANVANGEQLTLTVPAGTYPVDIVPTAASGPVVFGPVDLVVGKASLTRVFAIGVAATGSMDAVVQVLPVATRGGGEVPSRVDAGDGGQAKALIDARRAGAPESAWPMAVLLAALVAAVGLGGAVRSRARRA